MNYLFQGQRFESSLSGAAFESKIKAAARKLFSNLGIDDEVNNIFSLLIGKFIIDSLIDRSIDRLIG